MAPNMGKYEGAVDVNLYLSQGRYLIRIIGGVFLGPIDLTPRMLKECEYLTSESQTFIAIDDEHNLKELTIDVDAELENKNIHLWYLPDNRSASAIINIRNISSWETYLYDDASHSEGTKLLPGEEKTFSLMPY